MSIKIEATNKVFSNFGGLLNLKTAHKKFQLGNYLDGVLPTLKSGTARSFKKFENLMLGFQAGAECLDDMEVLAQDEGFREICGGKEYSAKAYGDFLRSFGKMPCKELNHRLIELAYQTRTAVASQSKAITIDIDSTSNQQYGKKMEGVAVNYNNINCLDTIVAFDELGLQYWHGVRPGNTHTGKGSIEIVHQIFSKMPRTSAYKKMRRYVRADSGFCRYEFFNACAAKEAGFVVTMSQTMYAPLLKRIHGWQAQNPSREGRIRFYDGRECEIADTVHKSKNSYHVLRVVLIRALKKDIEGQKRLFLSQDDYDYYGWISNIGEHEMSAQKLIKFYRKRGNAENFIKELKYGFDLKHYPCLKLDANRVYGLIGAFAHNFMRFLALKTRPNQPHFAKAIRSRFIQLPVQIVRHGRQVIFKYMTHHYTEVRRVLEMIKTLQLGFTT